MFTDELFEVWCLQHKLPEQAKTIISRIRSSPPSRLVRGAAGNVSGRYPSKKMGCTIQFESHRGELAFIYQMEHDSTVFAFYDQPEPIKLTYQGKTGKQVGLFHTPDFFVLRDDGGGWVECKMEDQLPLLAEQMPHRYLRNTDGTWSCPPGEAYAKAFGLTYRLFSSAEIDWVYQRNLRFLEDYLRFSRAPVELEIATYRYKILGRAFPEETIIPARTLQRWRCAFRTAEAIYGHGFVGLIPGQNRQGNHLPRLSQEADQLLEKYITEHYETLKQQSKQQSTCCSNVKPKSEGLLFLATEPFWIASLNGIGRNKRSNDKDRVPPRSTIPGYGS